MSKLSLIATAIVSAFLLTSCENTMFGMPESQFQTLSPSQKQQVINSYNQRESARVAADNQRAIIDAQNAPLNNLIGVANNAVSRINAAESRPQNNAPAPAAAPAPAPMPQMSSGFSMPSMPSMPTQADFKPGECQETSSVNGYGYRCNSQSSSHTSTSRG